MAGNTDETKDVSSTPPSMVIPVVTPKAKLMPNSLPQKRVMSFHTSLPVITYMDSMMTSSHTMPSVSGTNKK
jgi:hypothetical protein